ncbi:hypothetical protein GOP47_0003464 [Adiantum capillus-veneris]|uniref:Uncharacterized protein n=1 Tax=Adiantum capillus-veneris TaxID=13818 RepID=A0A9D4VDM2_ADICA|nr:hypothetical protein GOP47_0003464 [Adiantum capillus-veneris]
MIMSSYALWEGLDDCRKFNSVSRIPDCRHLDKTLIIWGVQSSWISGISWSSSGTMSQRSLPYRRKHFLVSPYRRKQSLVSPTLLVLCYKEEPCTSIPLQKRCPLFYFRGFQEVTSISSKKLYERMSSMGNGHPCMASILELLCCRTMWLVTEEKLSEDEEDLGSSSKRAHFFDKPL